jgi:hypothetical protein
MTGRFSAGPISQWTDYLKLFQRGAGRKAIGEASPCYLWSKTTPRAIASLIPDAKIVMILRNPVDRAFSQHLHGLAVDLRPISFGSRVEAALASKCTLLGDLYPFLEFGLYYAQVKRYFEVFPRKQVRIYFYEDYVRDPRGLLKDLFRFLGVDEEFSPDLSERHMVAQVPRSFASTRLLKRSGLWSKAGGLLPQPLRHAMRRVVSRPSHTLVPGPGDRARLGRYYAEDIQNLSGLLGRDLSHWSAVIETPAGP